MSINRLTVLYSRKIFEHQLHALLIVRFKGGGRPGGKPTFNWKERKQLRIQRKFDLKKLGVFSSFNIDEDDFDDEEEGADEVIDLTATDFFEEDRTFGGVDNTRKVLHPPLLFGSHKNAGILPRKEKTGPKHFRYARYLERKQAGNAS